MLHHAISFHWTPSYCLWSQGEGFYIPTTLDRLHAAVWMKNIKLLYCLWNS